MSGWLSVRRGGQGKPDMALDRSGTIRPNIFRDGSGKSAIYCCDKPSGVDNYTGQLTRTLPALFRRPGVFRAGAFPFLHLDNIGGQV